MVTKPKLVMLGLRRYAVKVYELLINAFCATVILGQYVVNGDRCRCSRWSFNPLLATRLTASSLRLKVVQCTNVDQCVRKWGVDGKGIDGL